MGECEEEKEGFTRKNNPIVYGLMLSVLLIGAYFLLGLQQKCIGTVCESNFERFFEADPNEIGDTLAGLFAALAFVWIIVTVFLQSHELREQRKEFREQREATQDMARAMAAQAAIFEDEQRQRREINAGQLFREQLLYFCSIIKRERNEVFVSTDRGRHLSNISTDYLKNLGSRGTGLILLPPIQEGGLEQQMEVIDAGFQGLLTFFEGVEEQGIPIEPSNAFYRFEAAMKVIDTTSQLFAKLSDADKSYFQRLRVTQVREAMHSISNLPIWRDETK